MITIQYLEWAEEERLLEIEVLQDNGDQVKIWNYENDNNLN